MNPLVWIQKMKRHNNIRKKENINIKRIT